MLSPLDLKRLPLPAVYFKQFGALLSRAAYLREASFASDNGYHRYELSIAGAVKKAATEQDSSGDMAYIAEQCLGHCWNECMDFIKEEGLTLPEVESIS